MRIALLTTQFITEARSVGGPGSYSLRAALALAERGHEVEVFTWADHSERIEHRGLLVHRVRAEGRALGAVNRLMLDRIVRSHMHLKLSWSVFRALRRRHRERAFNVVEALNLGSAGLVTSLTRLLPVVTRISSYRYLSRRYYSHATADLAIVEALDRLTIRKSTAAYAPSSVTARAVEHDLRIPVAVLRPPFFLETRESDDTIVRARIGTKDYLLFFGTLNVVKGVHVLAEALAELLPTYPDLHFVFAGSDSTASGSVSGSMGQFVRQRLEAYRDQVTYLGALPHEQLYPVVARARGVVLPSIFDNLPNACLEAMALGQVVIGTRGTSFDELLEDGVSGLLIPPGDAGALAKAMADLWSMDAATRERMGARAKAALAPFAPATAGAALEAFLARYARGQG